MTSPGGREAGRVSIRVLPDTSHTAADLRRELSAIEAAAKINVGADLSRFRQDLQAEVAAIAGVTVNVGADLTRFRADLQAEVAAITGVTVNVGADLTQFRATLAADVAAITGVTVNVGADLTRFRATLAADVAAITGVTVNVSADLTRFRQELQAEVSAIGAVTITVQADVRAFVRQVETVVHRAGRRISVSVGAETTRFIADILAAVALLTAQGIDIPVGADATRLRADIDAALAAIRAGSPTINVGVNTNRISRGLKSITSSAIFKHGVLLPVKLAGAATLAAGVAAATVNAFGLVGALSQAAGAAALIPAAMGAAAGIIATITIGVKGVKDAFKALASGDAKKIDQALSNLAPSAQDFVLQLHSMKSILSDIKKSVQQNLFKGLAADLQQSTVRILPAVKTGLSLVATGINSQVHAAFTALDQPKTVDRLQRTFGLLGQALDHASGAVAPMVRALTTLGIVGAKHFLAFSNGVVGAATAFDSFIERSRHTGAIDVWISNAMELFGQLGRILSNVGQTLGGIFAAGKAGGGGLLQTIGDATDAMARFVKSAPGQDFLTTVFQTAHDVIKSLAPILSPVLSIFLALAEPLSKIAQAIGPAIGAGLQALVPAIAGIAQGLQAAAPDLGVFITGLATLAGPIIKAIAKILPTVGKVLAELATTFQILGPPIVSMIDGLGKILKALEPILPTVLIAVGAFYLLKAVFATNPFVLIAIAVVAIASLIVDNWKAISKFLGDIWKWISTLAVTVWTAVATFFSNLWTTVTTAIVTAWNAIGTFFTTIWKAISTAAGVTWTGIKLAILIPIQAVKLSLISIWKTITSLLSGAWNGIKSAASAAWGAIKTVIINPVKSAVEWVVARFISMKDTLAGIVHAIGDGLKTAWDFVVSIIKIPINLFIAAINGVIWLINAFIDGINLIPGVDIAHVTPIAELAKGGTVTAAGLSLVGERGPELLNLPQGAQVIPLSRATVDEALAGHTAGDTKATGHTFNIVQQPGTDATSLAHEIDRIAAFARAVAV